MIKIFLSILLLVVASNASEMGLKGGGCMLTQEGPLVVEFKAYKTAAKIGVGGVFDNVVYTSKASSGKNFREILVGETVSINTASVNSKNKERDAKLVTFFFEKMVDKNISAKILDYTADEIIEGKPQTGTFTVEITMNGVTKTVPMNSTYDGGIMNANGVIDIFDFSANDALSSINKACYDLHKGKTWNDVAIGFTTNIKSTLCEVPNKKESVR